MNLYSGYLKRLLDLILSFSMFVLISPLLLVVAVLVRVKLGSPVIFKQERPGLHEKIFTMYKFRTMTDARDANGELLPDNLRLTKFGNFLRKTSLDELPELFNIILGDMAIVGPRPLLVRYLDLYNEDQHKRHDVRPGFTNIAAVIGRNSVPWMERLAMDTWYAEHVSFMLDVWIILQTVKVVLFKTGCPDAVSSKRGTLEDALKNAKGEKYVLTRDFGFFK